MIKQSDPNWPYKNQYRDPTSPPPTAAPRPMSTTEQQTHTPLTVERDADISQWWIIVEGDRPIGEIRREPDALRLQQCWNACAGIPDPQTAIPALVRAASAVIIDASSCTTAGNSLVSDELLCNLLSALAKAKGETA